MSTSTNEDLSAPDRAWAAAIAGLTNISVIEAEKRVRRIRYDTKIQARLHEIAAELGPNVVITNIEWSGPTMSDLTVSVAPPPTGVNEVVEKAIKKAAKPTPRGVRSSLAALSNMQLQVQEARARAEMRAQVARFELERCFGKPVSSLPMLVAWGLV